MDSRTLQLLEFPKLLDLLARQCVSEPGADACKRIRPMVSPEEIERQGELFRQFREWFAETGCKLASFPSLEGLFFFLEQHKGNIDLDGLFALKQVLGEARGMEQSLLAREGKGYFKYPALAVLAGESPLPSLTWSGLKRCLDDKGGLRDESSPELMSARSEIRRIHNQCSKKVKLFIRDNNLAPYLQDEFITISSDRYVLPLKTNFKGRYQGIIHDYSQTGETCYFEPMFLVDLNNELQELKKEERQAEKEVLADLSALVRREFHQVRRAYDFLIEIDVFYAKLAFASAYSAVPLVPRQSDPLYLRQARHPLLGPGQGAKPVDIELFPGQYGLIISGGNAGGKTVCLKTLGLIALMAQSGLPVPAAEESTLPLWTKVFVFIGDEQSLDDHVSTFTAQIHALAGIWDQADDRSLVILDEFGAGTDPSQGAALAQAVVDELIEKRACVAAATHFPAMKAYALAKEEVRAASVLFEPETGRPLYRLGFDQVGASKALDVARDHGLPQVVLERAHGYLLLDGSDASVLIERLNDLAVEREKEIRELNRERARMRDKRLRLDERFERERIALLTGLKDRSREILSDWRAGKRSHKQAMRELAQARSELAKAGGIEQPPKPSFSLDDIQRGDRVRYLAWSKDGVVEEVDLKRSRLKVDISGVCLWARPEDIRPLEAKSGPEGPKVVFQPPERRAARIDLRGRRVEEAEAELTSFLDQALLGDVREVEIVHGRGTGVLRKQVHEILKNFPAVSSYELADEEHGGDGMTLAELK